MGRPPKSKGAEAARRGVQRRIALMVAHGKTRQEIADSLGYDPATVHRIMNEPGVPELIEKFTLKAEDQLEQVLSKGEERAAEKLIELLEVSDANIVLKAAIRLTDMAGRRGRPVERVVTAEMQFTGPEAHAALQAALRDPTVQRYLEANPAVEQELQKQLSPPAEPAALPVKEAVLEQPEEEPLPTRSAGEATL